MTTDPAKGGGPPAAQIHVREVAQAVWAWDYVEPDTGVELLSNETYASREEAERAAGRAYPDLPLADEESTAQEETKARVEE